MLAWPLAGGVQMHRIKYARGERAVFLHDRQTNQEHTGGSCTVHIVASIAFATPRHA